MFLTMCNTNKNPAEGRPETFNDNIASYRKTREHAKVLSVIFCCRSYQLRLELIQSCAGQRTYRNDGRTRRIKKRSPQEIFDFQPDHLQSFGVDQIGFG